MVRSFIETSQIDPLSLTSSLEKFVTSARISFLILLAMTLKTITCTVPQVGIKITYLLEEVFSRRKLN